jgi:acyl carrier protein
MRIFPLTILSFLLFLAGCGPQPSQQTVDRVRSEVAEILGKDAAQIDVAKPLVEQGADDLDMLEMVMAVEEAFNIEIPESAIGEKVDEVSKTLTVKKLAKIVSKQQKK